MVLRATPVTYTPYGCSSCGSARSFLGTDDGVTATWHILRWLYTERGDVCMYVRGGGVIFDLVRSRQRYLFAVVSPWKDSIGFMKVVVRYYTRYIILIRFPKKERNNTCLCVAAPLSCCLYV